MTRTRSKPNLPASDRLGSRLSIAAALVWLGQAGLIAAVLSNLLGGAVWLSPWIAALGYLALTGLRIGLDTAAQTRLAAAAEADLGALRQEILDREARAATASSHMGPGGLAALTTEKLETLRPYLLRYRPAMARARVIPLVILVIAFWQSWAVGVVLAIAGPLIPVFMALIGIAAKGASERQMDEIGSLSDLLVDRLAALSDLRLAGAGPQVAAQFEAASGRLKTRTMAVLRIAFLSSTVLELFAALGVAMVAVWVGFTLLGQIGWGTWGGGLTPFAGIYLLLLTPDFFQPLRDLAAAWHDKAAAEAAWADLEAWRAEDRPPQIGAGVAATALPAPWPLRLQGLQVQRGGREIAYPDLEIAPGTSLALMGPSGVGKTTLLRLIAGLERPSAGQITLGDTPLDDPTARAWQNRIGWMPQAPHFLNRSVRHNLGFGAPIEPGLLAQARIDHVVAALPQGDLTLLGERGAGISGGEARRLTLARALHGGPEILLADEPTADLDAATAEAVTAGLKDFAAQGGTLIVATHDPALAAALDRVEILATGSEATA